jgi:molybdate/tungstate transport system substrate-binding protein
MNWPMNESNKTFRTLYNIAGLFVLSFVLYTCDQGQMRKTPGDKLSGDLIVFHAGSLAVPMKELSLAFHKVHPEVNILTEAAGSVASARKIADLNRKCDIMASADYTVIDKMLIPKYTSWNIKFVSNEISIVFTDKSKYSSEMTSDNWYKILMREDVCFGRADPNTDPCGYRSVMVMKLSEKHYGISGLADRFLAKDHSYMRPKEVDLLSLLETNNVDYIFIYKSVAVQHKLKFISLPDEVNLRNPGFSTLYQSVAVEINGTKPGQKIIQRGEPAVYGLTILRDAPNKTAAIAFIQFMLSKEGMVIMENCGQPSVIPAYSSTYDSIPEQFQQFARKVPLLTP